MRLTTLPPLRPTVTALLTLAAFAPAPAAAQTSDATRREAPTAPGAGPDGSTSGGSPAVPPFYGPLTTEDSSPLQRIAYTHATEGADLLPAGRLRADFWMGYANIFEQDSAATHDLFLDLERLITTAGVRWGASDRLEVGARLGFETTGGGILDTFVSGWHQTLGLGNGNRDKYPSGAYAMRLREGSRDIPLYAPKQTMALEDVRLFAKWRAWRSADGRKLVSVRGVARLPAEEDLFGARRSDVALMALGRVSGPLWVFHGTMGGSTVRAARDLHGLVRSGTLFADAALERRLATWVSGVLQLSFSSPVLRGFRDPELDGWPVNVVFGLTGAVRDGWLVDVSFQEDIPANTPAVDFTLGIGVRKSW